MGRQIACVLAMVLAAFGARAEEHVRGQYRFETKPEPAFVEQLKVPEQWPAKLPGASDDRWRYWVYDMQADHRGGRDRVYVDHVFEVRAASLLGEAGRFQIDFVPDFQKLAIHRVEVRRNGAWASRLDPARISLARREGEFEQDIANGSVTALIVLDDVRVGDVVRVSYSFDGANPMLAGQDTDWFPVAYRNPVLHLLSRNLYDPGTRLAVHGDNTDARPVITARADAVEARYEQHGLDGRVDAGDYPRWYSNYAALQVGHEQQWSDVVAWALPLYPKVTQPLPPDLEARITRWQALPDAVARLTVALRAVQDDVRYFGIEMGETTHRPHPPQETWTRRLGDCKDKAYLLATLLARLDIEAVPALVSARRGKAVARYLPAGDAFDHVIVRARVGTETVWLDPTVAQQGGDPRLVDLSELGVGLPVAAGTAALQPITRPAQARDGIDSVERFTAQADGAATLAVETTYRGGSADRARIQIAGVRSDELGRRYSEYYGKRFGKVVLTQAPALEDDRAANVFRVREAYRLEKPLKDEGGGVRSLELFAETLSSPAQLPASITHLGPLHVGAQGSYRHEVQLNVPAQWSPRFGHEQATRSSPAFAFSRRVDLDGRTSTVIHELTVKQADLPSDQVATHLETLRLVRDDLSSTLRFQQPAALGTKERDDRLKALLRDAIDTGASK